MHFKCFTNLLQVNTFCETFVKMYFFVKYQQCQMSACQNVICKKISPDLSRSAYFCSLVAAKKCLCSRYDLFSLLDAFSPLPHGRCRQFFHHRRLKSLKKKRTNWSNAVERKGQFYDRRLKDEREQAWCLSMHSTARVVLITIRRAKIN